MTVVAGDDWYDDSYWSSFTDEEFLKYLASMPEPTVIPYPDDYEPSGPWPGSVEARRWDYDNPLYEYEPEAEDDY